MYHSYMHQGSNEDTIDCSTLHSMQHRVRLRYVHIAQQLQECSADDDNGGTGRRKSKYDSIPSCTPVMVNQYITANSPNEDTEEAPVKTYKGVCCQVCVFEGRKTRTKSVAFCGKHGIRACLTTPNLLSYGNENFKNAVEVSTETELAMWRCPNVSESCWRMEKSAFFLFLHCERIVGTRK